MTSIRETVQDLNHVIQRAEQSIQVARDARVQALGRFRVLLHQHPPATFRIQEAYRNPDGSYEIHWDQEAPYRDQLVIDEEELEDHLLQEGTWREVSHDLSDDPRSGYRRVIDVTRPTGQVEP